MEKETELHAEVIQMWGESLPSFQFEFMHTKKNSVTTEVPLLFVTVVEHSRHRIFSCTSICTEVLHFWNLEKLKESREFAPVQTTSVSSFKFCLPLGTDEKLKTKPKNQHKITSFWIFVSEERQIHFSDWFGILYPLPTFHDCKIVCYQVVSVVFPTRNRDAKKTEILLSF